MQVLPTPTQADIDRATFVLSQKDVDIYYRPTLTELADAYAALYPTTPKKRRAPPVLSDEIAKKIKARVPWEPPQVAPSSGWICTKKKSVTVDLT